MYRSVAGSVSGPAGLGSRFRRRLRSEMLRPIHIVVEGFMTHVTYRIVQHDGGWAYKVGDVFSETFPSHEAALGAASRFPGLLNSRK